VQWETGGSNFYQVSIEVTAVDRPGMLSDILAAVAETRINMTSVNARTTKTKLGIITLVFEITNLAQLELLMHKIRRVQDVYSVSRAQPSQTGE
jgi:GTP pyrophosphokinase